MTWSGKVLPSKKQFLNTDLYFKEATEPLNILWENRHFTNADRLTRKA